MSDNILLHIVTGLSGFLIGNKLAIGRDKRLEFNKATEHIRTKIRDEIYRTTNMKSFGVNYSIITDIEKNKHLFSKIRVARYKKTIAKYSKQCKSPYSDPLVGDHTIDSENLNKNIKHLRKLLRLVAEK